MRADRYFALMELALIALFFINLIAAGTAPRALAGPWAALWVLVVLSLIPPLAGLGAPAARTAGMSQTAAVVSVLVGALLMRFAVIFSAQL